MYVLSDGLFLSFCIQESPHKCLHCGKMFNQRSNLKTHLATHVDHTLPDCFICKKGNKTPREYTVSRPNFTHTYNYRSAYRPLRAINPQFPPISVPPASLPLKMDQGQFEHAATTPGETVALRPSESDSDTSRDSRDSAGMSGVETSTSDFTDEDSIIIDVVSE